MIDVGSTSLPSGPVLVSSAARCGMHRECKKSFEINVHQNPKKVSMSPDSLKMAMEAGSL